MIHYLSQCWSRSILPYCIPRPQWVQSPSWFRYYFNNIPQISSKNLHDHKYVNHLTHWGRVTHIYVIELGHLWFRQWLVIVTYSAPSHYLNQCWNIVTLECQIEGQACLFIFHFLRPDLSLFGPTLLFFRGHLAACTKFKSDRPTETINLVNVDYFTCHLWELCHLISVYMAVIIHILHDENQSLLKQLFLQED